MSPCHRLTHQVTRRCDQCSTRLLGFLNRQGTHSIALVLLAHNLSILSESRCFVEQVALTGGENLPERFVFVPTAYGSPLDRYILPESTVVNNTQVSPVWLLGIQTQRLPSGARTKCCGHGWVGGWCDRDDKVLRAKEPTTCGWNTD